MSEHEDKDSLSLRVARGFLSKSSNHYVYCDDVDKFYVYKDGIYSVISYRDMEVAILSCLSSANKMTLARLKEVIHRIGTMKKVSLKDFNMGYKINFKNCLFDINDYSTSEHDKDNLSTIRIPYNYDKTAKCELWLKTISEIMEGDRNKIRTLQEFFGYCLTRDTSMEKCLILNGDGANGKSTILSVLEHVVGEDNCSSLSLRYVSDPQKISVLVGKLVNICGEVPKKIEDFEAEFRTIVTGEKMMVSPKYIPEYTFKPFCKLVMAVNEFPYIDDRTSAFYRRLLIIDLKRQFTEEEQNKSLKEDLIKEASGIFNWAIDGLTKLRERKTFLVDEYMRLMIESMKENNNPIFQWCKDNVMVAEGFELLKSEAYSNYVGWCNDNGYKPMGMARFSCDVYRAFKNKTEQDRRDNKTRKRIWPNLMLKNDKNIDLYNRNKIEFDE